MIGLLMPQTVFETICLFYCYVWLFVGVVSQTLLENLATTCFFGLGSSMVISLSQNSDVCHIFLLARGSE